MPNLKKKKESHLEEVMKDKMVIAFIAVVLVVSINFLVFSVLLTDREAAKAFSSGYGSNLFVNLGDQNVLAGTTDVLLANFIVPDSWASDSISCNYTLSGNPCVVLAEADGTGSAVAGSDDDGYTFLWDLPEGTSLVNSLFQNSDGICTDNLTGPSCIYHDSDNNCNAGDGTITYLLGTACGTGSDINASTATSYPGIWIHSEAVSQNGAYDFGADAASTESIWVLNHQEDLVLAQGSSWNNVTLGHYQGDNFGPWSGNEKFIDLDATTVGGYDGDATEPIIIDYDGDNKYSDVPDTLLDADGSATTGIGTDDDAIPDGASLTGLAATDNICINTLGQGGVGNIVIYFDGSDLNDDGLQNASAFDCVPGNGGTDVIIRNDPAITLGASLGTFPDTYFPVIGSAFYYDNNNGNGTGDNAYNIGVESLWIELQGVNQFNSNIEALFDADGTGSIGQGTDDDALPNGANLDYLKVTDNLCFSVGFGGTGLEDIYYDGSDFADDSLNNGSADDCIPGNTGTDAILLDLNADGLTAGTTFAGSGLWSSAAGTGAYNDHLAPFGAYTFGAGAAATESLWVEIFGSGTFTSQADLDVYSTSFGLPGDPLITGAGPNGSSLYYTDEDGSGTLTAADTVVEDIGNVQLGSINDAVLDRGYDAFSGAVLQNIGTLPNSYISNVRFFADALPLGSDNNCDSPPGSVDDTLIGTFSVDGSGNWVANLPMSNFPLFRGCVYADIANNAPAGTIKMRMPQLQDAGTPGLYDTGDLGFFVYSSNDGPTGGNIDTTYTYTIASLTGEGGIQVTPDLIVPPSGSDTGEGEGSTPEEVSLPENLMPDNVVKSATSKSVFVITSQGKRNVFPNEATFYSYFPDFSYIMTVSDTVLSQLPIGKNVTIRPGTYLIKLPTNPDVYAVEPGGVIRLIENENMAASLYGLNWASRVVDISDAYWPDYTVGDPMTIDTHATGSLIRYSGSADIYYIDAGLKKYVSADSFAQNKFQDKFIIHGVDISAYDYETGEDLGKIALFPQPMVASSLFAN